MTLASLWYVRRDGQVRGPFPEKLIRREIMLGRLAPEDELSQDRVNWLWVEDCPHLQPQEEEPGSEQAAQGEDVNWQEERRRARFRWEDERHLLDRRSGEQEIGDGSDERQWQDRRRPERAEELLLRQRPPEHLRGPARRERLVGVALVLVLLLVLALWTIMSTQPEQTVAVRLGDTHPTCGKPPTAQVNWSGCDKSSAMLVGVDLASANLSAAVLNSANLSGSRLAYANLTRSDLSYADLSGAQLLGAQLNQANLSQTNLSGADLRMADLKGARLDGAELADVLLDEAIWVDGRRCALGSVGSCR